MWLSVTGSLPYIYWAPYIWSELECKNNNWKFVWKYDLFKLLLGLIDVNELINTEYSQCMIPLWTFLTDSLVYIPQKEKNAELQVWSRKCQIRSRSSDVHRAQCIYTSMLSNAFQNLSSLGLMWTHFIKSRFLVKPSKLNAIKYNRTSCNELARFSLVALWTTSYRNGG